MCGNSAFFPSFETCRVRAVEIRDVSGRGMGLRQVEEVAFFVFFFPICRENLDAMESDTAAAGRRMSPPRLLAAGGMARNDLVMQMQADLTGKFTHIHTTHTHMG